MKFPRSTHPWKSGCFPAPERSDFSKNSGIMEFSLKSTISSCLNSFFSFVRRISLYATLITSHHDSRLTEFPTTTDPPRFDAALYILLSWVIQAFDLALHFRPNNLNATRQGSLSHLDSSVVWSNRTSGRCSTACFLQLHSDGCKAHVAWFR